MAKLNIPIERTNYRVEYGDTVRRSNLDGGFSKQRTDIIGAAFVVTANWILNREQHLYLNAFWETDLDFGSRAFTVDMILNHPLPKEYSAIFIEPLELVSQSGLSYRMASKLEALAPQPNHTLNQAIIDAYNADPNADLLNIVDNTANVETVGTIPEQTNSIGQAVNFDITMFFNNSGAVPSSFFASQLPPGLSLNNATGLVTGNVAGPPTTYLGSIIYGPNAGGIPVEQSFIWNVVA